MNLWFTLTLKKIGGCRKISVGCRVTKKSSYPRILLFYSSRNIYIFCLNFIGPKSSPNSSKPAIFTKFMNLSFICTLKKNWGCRKISVGCRVTQKWSFPKILIFFLIVFFFFYDNGPSSDPNGSNACHFYIIY